MIEIIHLVFFLSCKSKLWFQNVTVYHRVEVPVLMVFSVQKNPHTHARTHAHTQQYIPTLLTFTVKSCKVLYLIAVEVEAATHALRWVASRPYVSPSAQCQ